LKVVDYKAYIERRNIKVLGQSWWKIKYLEAGFNWSRLKLNRSSHWGFKWNRNLPNLGWLTLLSFSMGHVTSPQLIDLRFGTSARCSTHEFFYLSSTSSQSLVNPKPHAYNKTCFRLKFSILKIQLFIFQDLK
jgi:hypothetical protein